jgi:acyl-CoA thioesterase I
MKKSLTFTLAAPALFLLAGTILFSPAQDNSSATAAPIKLAFIGASITAGYGTPDPRRDSYPAQLARLLGAGWQLRNFGVSGTTLLHDGDNPYVKKPEYGQALAFVPDILVIDLGANDSKPQNFEAHPADFVPDYEAIVAAFRLANPKVKIYAALPEPAFPENYGIRESVITAKIIPAIRQAAADTHISIIDNHTPLENAGAHFPDKIHPDEVGAGLIARSVYAALEADFPSAISSR